MKAFFSAIILFIRYLPDIIPLIKEIINIIKSIQRASAKKKALQNLAAGLKELRENGKSKKLDKIFKPRSARG